MKYHNDSRYQIVEWEDETSMFDSEAIWHHGIECYVRTYRALVPIELIDDEEIDKYIDNHAPDCYI